MSERKATTTVRYTEAQSKAWLSSLARGMQRQGQSVFMVEELQPTWLPNLPLRAAYTIISRLLVGLVLGAIFGVIEFRFVPLFATVARSLIYGLAFGLGTGLLDLFYVQANDAAAVVKKSNFWLELKSICLIGFFLSFMGCFLLGMEIQDSVRDNKPTISLGGVRILLLIPCISFIWGIRRASRMSTREIQCIETLVWSRTKAAKATKSGCSFMMWAALAAGLLCFVLKITHHSGLGEALAMISFALLVLAGPIILVFSTVLAGFQAGVEHMKTKPNQGVALSLKSAISGFMTSGLFFGLVISCVSLVVRAGNHHIGSDAVGPAAVFDGMAFGVAIASLFGLWYGGLDILLHYSLRLLLYCSGRLPLHLVPFLNHAEQNLNFLQKVGGGYIFIHRMLLEHFAALDTNPQTDRPNSDAGQESTAANRFCKGLKRSNSKN